MVEFEGGTVGKGDVGTPQIVEDEDGGVPPEEIDPSISGD
jgi:hypothetical protein